MAVQIAFTNRWQLTLFMNEVLDALRPFDPKAARIVAEIAAQEPGYTGPIQPILEELGQRFASARGAGIWGGKDTSTCLSVTFVT